MPVEVLRELGIEAVVEDEGAQRRPSEAFGPPDRAV
jgi:hypothetical protein